MARAAPRGDDDRPVDAIALLKQDHRTVEELFKKFEDTDGGEGIPIAQRVCQLLTVHAQIEEEILYPAAKEALADDEEESVLVYEAEVEHATAKDLIAQIEEMTAQDETYNATVKVLSEYIKHHVKEEEGELFPALRKTELDLKEMGEELRQRKEELMAALGIEAEDEPDVGRPSRAKARTKSRSASRSARH
jgi:hemerythrin-like domain-containing protein